MRKIRISNKWLLLVLFILSFIMYFILGYIFLQKFPNYRFTISGYDAFLDNIIKEPILYAQATIRHPLLSLYMIPLHFIYSIFRSNYFITFVFSALSAGANCYMYLILNKLVKLNKFESLVFTLLFISFAYILLMGITPESYPLSLFILVYSLYYIGNKLIHNTPIQLKQYIVLFFITAGITITNGLKILLGILFESISLKRKFSYVVYISIFFLVVITPVYIGTKVFIENKKNETTSNAELILPEKNIELIKEESITTENKNTTHYKLPTFTGYI